MAPALATVVVLGGLVALLVMASSLEPRHNPHHVSAKEVHARFQEQSEGLAYYREEYQILVADEKADDFVVARTRISHWAVQAWVLNGKSLFGRPQCVLDFPCGLLESYTFTVTKRGIERVGGRRAYLLLLTRDAYPTMWQEMLVDIETFEPLKITLYMTGGYSDEPDAAQELHVFTATDFQDDLPIDVRILRYEKPLRFGGGSGPR